MADVWLELPGSLLRPARPDAARCLAERELHLKERKRLSDERGRAVADCERRIETARAAIFAASDGVVGAKMTELEREWRALAKVDPDAGLMDLWARIAPPAWHDRKRWRDCPPMDRVDVAVALASDVEGVEAAESAVLRLRAAFGKQGIPIAPRVAWRFFDQDRAVFVTTFREPPPRIREDVRDAVLARFPNRPFFARDVAWLATQTTQKGEIVDAVRAVWRAGYNIHSFDAQGITLEIPSL
jgi:hypothetical protein